ncbi:MAG: CaiB/BaiF CoA transferase family protein, partial [Vulcanimicrobiaceae bacterium]
MERTLTQTAQQPPLTGIRVLDFTHVIAGPFCTQMLADMGADVVKVERPGAGDDLRHIGRYPGRENHEDYFNSVNRRKRSITLDLSDPKDLETCYKLVERADVAVQNFGPKTAQKLGIDAEAIRARNPRIVYCAISGFGQTGPLRDRLAMDSIIQAHSGVMSVTGDPDGDPMALGAPLADVISGMTAAYSIVATLFEARRTGIGASLDISMLESMIAALSPRMGETLQGGRQPARVGNENPMRVPAGTFKAADGKFVALMSHDQGQWPRLCRALGHPEWIDDPRFATLADRVKNREEVHRMVGEVIATKPSAEWDAPFAAERVPFAPVNDYHDALINEHINSRGLVFPIEHPKSGTIRLVGPPWKTTLPSPPLVPPPVLGHDQDEVLE